MMDHRVAAAIHARMQGAGQPGGQMPGMTLGMPHQAMHEIHKDQIKKSLLALRHKELHGPGGEIEQMIKKRHGDIEKEQDSLFGNK